MIRLPLDSGLHLVQLQPDDAEELFALTDINRVYLRRWLPWLDRTRVLASTEAFIRFTQEEAQAGCGLHLAILEQGLMVGVCGYNRVDALNRQAAIGYWLSADAQGRGTMTRCVRALTAYGFAEGNLHRQVIAVAEGNQPSASVAERCGYRFEGVARDAEWLYDHFVSHRIYARLRTDD